MSDFIVESVYLDGVTRSADGKVYGRDDVVLETLEGSAVTYDGQTIGKVTAWEVTEEEVLVLGITVDQESDVGLALLYAVEDKAIDCNIVALPTESEGFCRLRITERRQVREVVQQSSPAPLLVGREVDFDDPDLQRLHDASTIEMSRILGWLDEHCIKLNVSREDGKCTVWVDDGLHSLTLEGTSLGKVIRRVYTKLLALRLS